MERNKSSPSSIKRISNFVFQTNHILRRGLKSESFVDSTKHIDEKAPKKDIDTQTNFKSVTHVACEKKIEVVKENSTQTSVTTFFVASTKTESLSPDSLSPKQENNVEYIVAEDVIVSSSNKTVIKSSDQRAIPFNRKQTLMNYLESPEEHTNMDLLTGNSLIKTFLRKNRNKGKLKPSQSTEVQSESLTPHNATNPASLKSQSYVDSSVTKNTATHKRRDLSRFRVSNVNEKEMYEDRTIPVRYFCQTPVNLNFANPLAETPVVPSKSKRSMSFMSPTIASEKKDQSIDIKHFGRLIPAFRRGRSASPRKFNKELVDNTSLNTVPYIDKSEASFRAKSDMSEVSNNYNESADKQLQLDLQLSCEELHNITDVRSIASTISTTETLLYQALTRLRDQDWTTALRGVAEMVEIIRNSDVDFVYPHMTVVNQRLIELIRSPRSHVTRTACQAIGHLFEYVKDTRRPEFDELVHTLLCKTADSNKFIRHDANLALDCMVTHIPTFHAVRSLCIKGPDHKNALVRTATARLIVCAVIIAGPQNILYPRSNEYTRRRIILNMVKFLNDKCIEIRKFGERLYKLLYKDRIFEVYLKKYLERDVIIKIKNCMRHSPNLAI